MSAIEQHPNARWVDGERGRFKFESARGERAKGPFLVTKQLSGRQGQSGLAADLPGLARSQNRLAPQSKSYRSNMDDGFTGERPFRHSLSSNSPAPAISQLLASKQCKGPTTDIVKVAASLTPLSTLAHEIGLTWSSYMLTVSCRILFSCCWERVFALLAPALTMFPGSQLFSIYHLDSAQLRDQRNEPHHCVDYDGRIELTDRQT